jgi:hypothetical protein
MRQHVMEDPSGYPLKIRESKNRLMKNLTAAAESKAQPERPLQNVEDLFVALEWRDQVGAGELGAGPR